MKPLQINLSREDIFRGLNNEELEYIKLLLPKYRYNQDTLNEAIKYLSPRQQRRMDILLKKARQKQRIRFHIKRLSLMIFSILVIVLSIYFLNLLKGV